MNRHASPPVAATRRQFTLASVTASATCGLVLLAYAFARVSSVR